jgi:hypothetical protein
VSIGVFILVSFIKTVIAVVVLLTAVAYTVWLERKVVVTSRTVGVRVMWGRLVYCSLWQTG